MDERILIIDDERDMQIYLRTLLRKAGYEPVIAGDGEAGVEMALDDPPALITLDLIMPRRSGATAYERLRSEPTTRAIPIVVVTGVAVQPGMFGAPELGLPPPDAVLDKPIDRAAFLDTVAELIGGPR